MENIWCSEFKNGDVWNAANKSARHGKSEEKRRSQPIVWKLFFCVVVYLLASLELRPHVDVAECRIFFFYQIYKMNFIRHLFLPVFSLFVCVRCCHLGFGYPLKGKGIRHTHCVLTQPNGILAFSNFHGGFSTVPPFIPLDPTKIHFPLVAMIIIAKDFSF